jgi:hypothetical protein
MLEGLRLSPYWPQRYEEKLKPPNNLSKKYVRTLWNQQRRITITQKTEVMSECIVINLMPVPFNECTYKK